ncbi:MAG: TonB-dependent receptor, partial [Gammaproteobacteria bacterium]|nr:TonB-dependent receptor [Gammaproteobacteria bacterium]
SYAISVGRNETDGILAFNNQFRHATATGRVQGQLDEATDASVSVRYEDRRFHYPTDGSGNLEDENSHSFGDALSVNVDAGRRWNDAFETRFRVNVHESDSGTDAAPDGPADTLGFHGFKSLADLRRTTVGGRAIWRPGEGTSVATGYELEQQSVRDFSESLSQYGPSSANSRNERGNRAFYAQLSEFRGPAALNAGLRLEDNERFGSAMTWRAGAAWRAASSGTRVRVSAGTGIKEPTFYETYATGFATGNPDLEPEQSTSYEAGLDQELGGIARLSLTGFRQNYRNLIQYTFSPPAAGGPNYHNVARARSRGLEAEASVAASRVRLSSFYTYLNTEVEDSGFDEGPSATFVEGEPLLRRPGHIIGASAFAQVASGIGLDASVRRTGERSDRDFSAWPANPVTLSAYTLVDLAASFELGSGAGRPGMRLTVRMENLLDQAYHEVWGFAAPGRAVYVGGSLALGGGEG